MQSKYTCQFSPLFSAQYSSCVQGVVNAAVGQENGSREHLKIAQQYFQLVGGSASECDTIPGRWWLLFQTPAEFPDLNIFSRQCMAACFFLLKQFDDVLLYLNSIKSYFYSEDTFNFNYGQAKAAVGNYQEAEEIFLNINDEKLKTDYAYLSWLARCFIMNSKVGPSQSITSLQTSLSGETGLGVVFKNGNLGGVIFSAATNSQRLLQNGTVLLCRKGRQRPVVEYSTRVNVYLPGF